MVVVEVGSETGLVGVGRGLGRARGICLWKYDMVYGIRVRWESWHDGAGNDSHLVS